MKKFTLVLAAATVLASAPGLAADLRPPVKAPAAVPPPPYFNWNGFYIGGFVGGAFPAAGNGADVIIAESGPTVYQPGGRTPFGYELESSLIGGGTVGWNFQAPGSPFVFGIEGEAGYMQLRNEVVLRGSLAILSTTKIGDWYGMITGRLGYAWDRALVYVKGGGAFIERSAHVSDTCTIAPCGIATVDARGRSDEFAWTVGGGIEFALTPTWSVKGEYMYIDTRETITAAGIAVPSGASVGWDHTLPGVHTAKFGINYRFGGPVMARY